MFLSSYKKASWYKYTPRSFLFQDAEPSSLADYFQRQEWDKLDRALDAASLRELSVKYRNGAGLLDRAIVYDSPAPIVAKLLDKGLSPNDARGNGATPVFIAAQINANPKLMELLLNNGGDPNKTTNGGCTPAFIAAQNNVNPRLMELLLDKGGDPNKSYKGGYTPVFIAAQNNVHPKLMEVLLDKGGNPNLPRKDGWTPLHTAAENGASVELVRLMLEYGADPAAANRGHDALKFAQIKKRKNLVELLENPPPQSRWPSKGPLMKKKPGPKTDIEAFDHLLGHLMFFSYAQQDCAAETMHLADKASLKFKGASIFRDADVKFKLDELVEHVKQSRNVIVLLSEHYARRPFTLVELHTALKIGANVVAVKVSRPGLKPFDFAQVTSDIDSGKLEEYLDSKGWELLNSYDIDAETVGRDLKAVMNVRACDFNMGSAARVLAAMIEDVFDGIVV